MKFSNPIPDSILEKVLLVVLLYLLVDEVRHVQEIVDFSLKYSLVEVVQKGVRITNEDLGGMSVCNAQILLGFFQVGSEVYVWMVGKRSGQPSDEINVARVSAINGKLPLFNNKLSNTGGSLKRESVTDVWTAQLRCQRIALCLFIIHKFMCCNIRSIDPQIKFELEMPNFLY